MDPLPANPLPNATALKRAPSPVAATMPSSKPTPAQAAVAPTLPIAANVQSPPVNASGLDARSTTSGNPSAVLMPGQLTAKLNPLPGNLPLSGLTSQNFNNEKNRRHLALTLAHKPMPNGLTQLWSTSQEMV